MNIAQLSEQLKDVPQAKLIDYAKNPNSVVPQFLALAEIQRRQTLMRATPSQPVSSSVAEDIMAQESPRMSGVATLPTRAMFTEEGMAGGGIVAFAEGGDLDADEIEDYFDNLDQSKAMAVSQRLRSMLSEMPMSYDKARATQAVPPPPRGEEQKASFANPLARLESMPSRRAVADEGIASLEPKKGSHKYEDMVLNKAKQLNDDPQFLSLARHVLYKETGNLTNPESATSKAGARGIMQLMPATAKMLGVNPDIPEENILGGVTYLNQLYKKYNGDPVLTAAAYNAGPGRVDRALKGEGLKTLPRETRMYIAGLADGGSVKSYRVGGDTDVEDPELVRQAYIDAELMRQRKLLEDRGQSDQAAVRKAEPIPLPPMEAKSSQADARKAEKVSAPVPNKPPVPMPRQSSQAEVRAVDNEILARQNAAATQNVPPAAQTNVPPTTAVDPSQMPDNRYLSMLEKDLDRQIAEAKRTGDQDKYLALMQAGFAMMGGTSPYATANIGQGAMSGLGAYAASQKAQREAEKGILQTRLGLAKAATTAETARQNRELIEMSKRERLQASKTKEGQDVIETAEARFNQDPMVKKIAAQLQDISPTDPAYGWYQRELDRLRNNAYARAKIPGYSMIPNPEPFPETAKKPGFFQSLFGGGSKPAASSTPVDFSKLPS